MKKIFLIILGIGLCMSSYSQISATPQLTTSNYAAFANQKASTLKDSLHLTNSQKNQVKQIYMDFLLSIIKTNNDSLQLGQRSAAIKELIDKRDSSFKQIFTEVQYARYLAILNNVRRKRNH